MILLDDEQIEDARAGIQADMSKLIGHEILVRIVQDPDEVKFWIDGLFVEFKAEFDEICSRHIERVSKVGYG